MTRWLAAGLVTLLLAGAAVADNRLTLSDAETRVSASEKPLLARRLGRVSLDIQAPCLGCGDTAYPIDKVDLESRLRGEFLGEVRRQMRGNGVLDKAAEQRLSVAIFVQSLSLDSTVGAQRQRKDPMTNGGHMVSAVTLLYVVNDGDKEVLKMPLTTQGTSNSMSPAEASLEAVDAALKKNLRIFLLGMKGALEPGFAATAQPMIQAIAGENASTRGLIGYFVSGMAHLGVGVVSVAGAVLEAAAMAATPENLAAIQRSTELMANERIAANNRTSQLVEQAIQQKNDEAAARQAQAQRAAEERNQARREANAATDRRMASQQQQADDQRKAEQQRREQREAEARREQQKQAEAAEDRRKAEEARRKADEAQAQATARRQAAKEAEIAAAAREAQRVKRAPGDPDEDGCIGAIGWCSSAPDIEQRGDTTFLTFRNTCPFRVYVSYATRRTDGILDQGADGVRAGGTLRNSTSGGNGRSFVSVIGATKAMADWTCAGKARSGELGAFEAGDLTLREKSR